jgi:hypothetical protein
MSANHLSPKCDDFSAVRTPRYKFSYVLIVTTLGVDLFKVHLNGGSCHLAGFPSLEEAIAFTDSLPAARMIVL